MVVVLALLAGLALPVTAVQILWINLITAITLGLALAFEPTESGTMARPPRRRNAPILSGELVWHVVLVALLFLVAVFGIFSYAIDKGHPLALAQTMAMNTLVVLEIFHLFFIRNIHGTSLTWAAARGTKVVWTRRYRHYRSAIRGHLPPATSVHTWNTSRTPFGWPADCCRWGGFLCTDRDRKADQAGIQRLIDLASACPVQHVGVQCRSVNFCCGTSAPLRSRCWDVR